MARIDFAFGATDRLLQACLTTSRQYLAGQQLLIICSKTETLRQLDALLWTQSDTSFIPHVWADDALAASTPIILAGPGHIDESISTAGPTTWLLNLDDACPSDLGRIERVLEIVSDDPMDKEAARTRWRQYQAAGHTLKAHSLVSASDDSR